MSPAPADAAKRFPALFRLDLGGTATTDDGLAPLAGHPALASLDVRNTKVTKPGAEKLAATLPNCRIEYPGGVIEPQPKLDPEVRKAVDWAMKNVGQVYVIPARGKGYRLHRLDELDAIARPRLRIDIMRGASDDTINHLSAVTDCETLKLHEGPLSDAGLKRLAALPLAKTLRELALTDVKVTAAGLDHLAALPQLADLTLAGCAGFDCAELAQLKKLGKLTGLTLRDPKLTAEHLKALAGLGLTRLSLANNPQLTDDALAPLAGCAKLTSLDLIGTKVTKAGAEALAKTFPKCKIEYNDGRIGPK